MVEQNKKSKKY